jgi:hypothetical protein
LVDVQTVLDGPHAGRDGVHDRHAQVLLERLDDVQDAPARAEHVDAVCAGAAEERLAGVGVHLV